MKLYCLLRIDKVYLLSKYICIIDFTLDTSFVYNLWIIIRNRVFQKTSWNSLLINKSINLSSSKVLLLTFYLLSKTWIDYIRI